MSYLLSDIKLDFEALASDPIEVGMHYGKSVLRVLSNKVTKPTAMLDDMAVRYKIDSKPKVAAISKPISSQRLRNATAQPPGRANFRRNFEQVQTAAYAQRRGLVGSL